MGAHMTSDQDGTMTAAKPGAGELPTDLVVAVSADEESARAGGWFPIPETRGLRGFPPARLPSASRRARSPLVDAMYRDYGAVRRWGARHARTGAEIAPDPFVARRRYQITPRMSGAFRRAL
jgi:hypothetical protein